MTDAEPASRSDDGPQGDGEPPPRAHPKHCRIDIQNPCRYPDVRVGEVRPFVAALVAELAPRARSFALRFVSDREMRRLNASFRRIDRPTDVLSFPGDLAARGGQEPGWPADVEGDHLGDVAVSVPTARRQAAELGHATAHELRLLVIHGLLHCLGHDHESDDGEMDQLERSLRCRYLEATPVAAAANAGRSHGR